MPPAPQPVAGLAELADRYDVLLCDVWGVLHDGVAGFPPAIEALRAFRRGGGRVVLISNSPRPGAEVIPQLRALAVDADAHDDLVTSGDVTRALLAERTGRRMLAIGPARDAPLYAGLDLPPAGPETAEFICCTGPVDDERENAEDYRSRLEPLARRGVEMICANPDRVVQRGGRLIVCAGALADLYAALGGPVVTAGKPFAPIYAAALERAGARSPEARARVLAVGDGVATDVLGANREGLDCLFVAAGIHAAGALADGALSPAGLAAALDREGAHARYALAALRW